MSTFGTNPSGICARPRPGRRLCAHVLEGVAASLLVLLALPLAGGELSVGGTGAVGAVGAPLPASGQTVSACDSRCQYRGRSTDIPSGWSCYQLAVYEYVREELLTGRLTAGGGVSAATAAARLLPLPEVEWGSCPRYIESAVTDTGAYSGCAAGIAGFESIFVSLAEPDRRLPLVAWETANTLVYWRLQRWDLADATIIANATSHATATCSRQALATE